MESQLPALNQAAFLDRNTDYKQEHEICSELNLNHW